jgi:uncharacterized protein YkuJ
VEVYLGTKKLREAITDTDGWYMIKYKHTGKSATFTLKLYDEENYFVDTIDVTLKANKFVQVNFEI